MSSASDYIIENGVLKKYIGPGGDVVIPEGVTSIGREAFSECSGLTSVTIPITVTNIGEGSFQGCINLTKTVLPKRITNIGKSAFCNCESLESIVLPTGMTAIPARIFQNCKSLSTVLIPAGITRIGSYAFNGCKKITNLTIPEDVTSICDDAFRGCYELTSISLPKSLQRIGQNAFRGSSLKQISIPEGVTSIGEAAFAGCNNLAELKIPDSVSYVGDGAFSSCKSIRVSEWSPAIADAVSGMRIALIFTKEISKVTPRFKPYALLGFIKDSGADLTAEQISGYMTYLSKNMTSLCGFAFDHPELLFYLCEQKRLPAKAVDVYMQEAEKRENTELRALLLNYQNTIGSQAITKARARKEKNRQDYEDALIERTAARDPTKGIDGMVFTFDGEMRIWYSRNDIKEYLLSYGARLSVSVTKKTDYLVTNNPESGSEKCRKAEELGVPVIDETTFNYMVGKHYPDEENIIVYSWIKEIPSRACAGNKKAKSVTIPEGVTRIGWGAFSNCVQLEKIRIPASVTEINGIVFDNCPKLTIHAPTGSYAEQYAKEEIIPFVAE